MGAVSCRYVRRTERPSNPFNAKRFDGHGVEKGELLLMMCRVCASAVWLPMPQGIAAKGFSGRPVRLRRGCLHPCALFAEPDKHVEPYQKGLKPYHHVVGETPEKLGKEEADLVFALDPPLNQHLCQCLCLE
jgi:hypothetical protein